MARPASLARIFLKCRARGLFVGAAVLALEANALRVAGISVGLEHLGAIPTRGETGPRWKTTGPALAQRVGIGRLLAR